MAELPPLSVLAPELARQVEAILQAYDAPGAAVAVAMPGGALFAQGFGLKHMNRRGAVTSQTAFNVGSTSKAFCSCALAILADEGRLSWEDPVRRWIPNFETRVENDDGVMTLRDLSGNRSGLPRNGILEFGTELAIDATEVVRRLRFAEPAAALRTRFNYSNIGHTAAALAAEAASGLEYCDLLQRRIFTPLGMNDAVAGASARAFAPAQAGWHCAVDGRTLEIDPIFTDVHRGSAGVCLSAQDAAYWLAFLLGDGGPLLSSNALEALFEPQIPILPEDLAIWIGPPDAAHPAYALGWAISDQNGVTVARHSGSDFGINAHVSLARQAGVGVAVYVNKDCKASIEINYTVLDVLMGWPARDWREIIADPGLPDTNSTFRHSLLRANGAIPARPLDAYAGGFRSDREGPLAVRAGSDALRAAFADGPVFDGALTPLGGDVFLLEPAYPGLVSDAVGGRFEARFSFEDQRATELDIIGLGRFART